jgi:Zn-dependent protease
MMICIIFDTRHEARAGAADAAATPGKAPSVPRFKPTGIKMAVKKSELYASLWNICAAAWTPTPTRPPNTAWRRWSVGSAGTMVLSLAVYALFYGWRYAVGFIALLFVHEMGHYLAARQRGLNVGLPTFIPFVGAWIELKDQPTTPRPKPISAWPGRWWARSARWPATGCGARAAHRTGCWQWPTAASS